MSLGSGVNARGNVQQQREFFNGYNKFLMWTFHVILATHCMDIPTFFNKLLIVSPSS